MTVRVFQLSVLMTWFPILASDCDSDTAELQKITAIHCNTELWQTNDCFASEGSCGNMIFKTGNFMRNCVCHFTWLNAPAFKSLCNHLGGTVCHTTTSFQNGGKLLILNDNKKGCYADTCVVHESWRTTQAAGVQQHAQCTRKLCSISFECEGHALVVTPFSISGEGGQALPSSHSALGFTSTGSRGVFGLASLLSVLASFGICV